MDRQVSIELFSFGDECTVETLVFGEAARRARRAAMEPPVEIACRACGSDLVLPLEWSQAADDTWLMLLRCPECEAVYEVSLGRSTLERFIAQLHAQKRALIGDLRRLDAARFREDVEHVLSLIEADQVIAADF